MQSEEFASLQLDRPILHELKTEEQLKRHTVDVDLELKPIDRGLHLLSKGDDIQKLSVIQTLPSLLAGDAQSCISRLMPKMQQTLPTASTEFHTAASNTFKTILEQRLVSHSTFTQTFLQSILNSLDSRELVVAHAWLETLLDVIDLLPAEVIRQEILPMAINKGQLSQPVSSRITCSKLVGKICTRFESQLIKKEVLPTVHSLCQDVNSDVRACICLQLRFVAEGLDPESVKPALLPSIVELASDEESDVRHASVQTIVHLLPQLQTDVIKNTIAPLIKKLCDSAIKSDDTVICVIAQEFGKLALGLEKCLTAAEKTWHIQYFQQLSQLGVPTMKKDTTKHVSFISNNPDVNKRYVECRWKCAFNIPAMFLFVSSASEDVEVLLPTFTDLAGDPYYMIRKTIACGIHEVAKILGPRNSMIKNELITLLKDDADEVLQGLVPHLAKTFEFMLQSQTIGTEQIDSSVMDLGRALLKCEGKIATTNNWRLSVSMFEQMEILPKCFPSDFIYTYFVPVALIRALNARPMPVRLAAGRTFLIFLRYNTKPTQRTTLQNRLYAELARNRNSYVRMLYIRMMIEAMTIFSSMYFKEYFYATVLSLTEDPIANVRLKVVSLLPALKSFIRLPSDKKHLSSLEASVRNLMNNEKDRDVVHALKNAIQKLDGIDVRHEGQSAPAKLSKHEAEDLEKYEEEKRLLHQATGKVTTGSSQPVQTSIATTKKHPMTTKLSGPARMGNAEMGGGRIGRQNSASVDPQRSSAPTVLPKTKQTGPPISMSDTPTRTSRQNTTAPRLSDMSKASTSSNDLTSSWAQLTSNSMLLTHLWERINLSDSNISVRTKDYVESTCEDYAFHEPYDYVNDPQTNRFDIDHQSCESHCKSMKFSTGYHCNNDFDYSKSRINDFYKHDCYPSSVLSKTLLLSHIKKERNACWAFSSMPEIPVPLRDDEFFIDAGIRMPAQLSTCHVNSRIPKLQEIIYRNRRVVGNVDRSSSSDRSRNPMTNLEKGKTKRYLSMHEDCLKPRSTSVDQAKINRLSMNYDDDRQRSKSNIDDHPYANEDSRIRRYSTPRTKSRMDYDLTREKIIDEQTKRSSMRIDKEKTRVSQSKNFVDRTKRHSINYSSQINDSKDSKQKFKRHSLEMTDCPNAERTNRLKRNFTLDVNHNQGTSKITALRSALASGSRTAPVTRSSSPVRTIAHLTSFDRDYTDDVTDYSLERKFLNKFSSSDEEVDKLCIRIAYLDPPSITDDRTNPRASRLPVWMRRKKP